jgi:hypothetical protein
MNGESNNALVEILRNWVMDTTEETIQYKLEVQEDRTVKLLEIEHPAVLTPKSHEKLQREVPSYTFLKTWFRGNAKDYSHYNQVMFAAGMLLDAQELLKQCQLQSGKRADYPKNKLVKELKEIFKDSFYVSSLCFKERNPQIEFASVSEFEERVAKEMAILITKNVEVWKDPNQPMVVGSWPINYDRLMEFVRQGSWTTPVSSGVRVHNSEFIDNYGNTIENPYYLWPSPREFREQFLKANEVQETPIDELPDYSVDLNWYKDFGTMVGHSTMERAEASLIQEPLPFEPESESSHAYLYD